MKGTPTITRTRRPQAPQVPSRLGPGLRLAHLFFIVAPATPPGAPSLKPADTARSTVRLHLYYYTTMCRDVKPARASVGAPIQRRRPIARGKAAAATPVQRQLSGLAVGDEVDPRTGRSFDHGINQGRAMRQNVRGARAKAPCAAVMRTGRAEDAMVVAPYLSAMDVQMMRARASAARGINSASPSCSR